MADIPREKALDSTLALRKNGYLFVSNRCRAHDSDIFEARLLLERTLCMLGHDAARLFYEADHFSRAGAVPARVQKTLFGQGGVQGLDGAAHRQRKAMFLSLMGPGSLRRMRELTAVHWRAALPRWQAQDRLVLFPAVREVLCRAVCEWAGVPLPDRDVGRRSADLGAMIDGAAAVGPAHWRSRRARRRCEAWGASLVEAVRNGRLEAAQGSPLQMIASYRDAHGRPLAPRVAAVELLNLLRPTLAIGRYITFAALALHREPSSGEAIRAGDDIFTICFVHEVRRFYPLFPFVGARVRDEFEWRGMRFPRQRRVLLDLYGTNHDPRLWTEPEAFRPQRFCGWQGDGFALIPQGGGEHASNHRCAGEWLTIAVLETAADLLAKAMRYRVPVQDLQFDLGRIPALPASGFVMAGVRGVD